ncbi:hypothetical protein [Nostoc sp.]|uniref:hypothetical protein n=1 Tax=Nostoc sp. TaxID=1180 RepID=UPI002FF86B06
MRSQEILQAIALWEFRISLFCFAQSRNEAIAYSKSSILVLSKGNQILYDYKH